MIEISTETISDLKVRLESDLKIPKDDLMGYLHKLPNIYSYWLAILVDIKHEFIRKDKSNKKLKLYLELYYNGKLSGEVYKLKPLDTTVKNMTLTKQHLEALVSSDDEMIDSNIELETISLLIDYVDRGIRGINDNKFIVKNIIDLKKFESGM